MSEQRRRSADHECRRCSGCEGNSHHWMHLDGDEFEDLPPEAAAIIQEDTGFLIGCKHCPAWLELLGEDDDEETDFDAEWASATVVNAS